MADATVFRDTRFLGNTPVRGTSPIAANTYLVKGTMVAVDGSGNLVSAGDAAATRIVGKISSNFDNRTGSEAGGLAGDLEGEYEYGVFMYDCSDSFSFGANLYAVDNQTVSTDDSGATRPFVGKFCELREAAGRNQAAVYIGPLVTE